MPPRKTRSTKVMKGAKENVTPNENAKVAGTLKSRNNITRKPLGDKTNSASDDNLSVEAVESITKPVITKNTARPKRERRLPSRLIDIENLKHDKNAIINNIIITDNDIKKPVEPPKQKTLPEKLKAIESKENVDTSLVANRSKRIHRLPARFSDHSISPSKFVPIHPCFSSTPVAKKTSLVTTPVTKKFSRDSTPIAKKSSQDNTPIPKKPPRDTTPVTKTNSQETTPAAKRKVQETTPIAKRAVRESKLKAVQNLNKRNVDLNITFDNTNKVQRAVVAKRNAQEILPEPKKAVRESKAANKENVDISTSDNAKIIQRTPIKKSPEVKRLMNKSYSFRVLDEKSPKVTRAKLAVYDFTFDPAEEPPPQKKKKKATKKKAKPAPKPVIISNNYDKNLSKTLESLKETVKKKTQNVSNDDVLIENCTNEKEVSRVDDHFVEPIAEEISVCNENRIESNQPSTHNITNKRTSTVPKPISPQPANVTNSNQKKDPLNLLDEISFDYEPVASSSINTSTRIPGASPWRTEFESLPVKWQINSYVKPNMTPSVETSYVNFNESKRHVYTDIVDLNEPEPDTSWKQTSILSFIKENADKKKKKRKIAEGDGPTRANLPKVAMFRPSSDVVNKLYNEMKEANIAPIIEERNEESIQDDSQSVHLFEDVDVVHHVNPQRKSYGKSRKVTFNKGQDSVATFLEEASSDEDNDGDKSFRLPHVKNVKAPQKKKKPGIKLTKKEEKEVEEWAAAFNSMCEDVDGFDLVVE